MKKIVPHLLSSQPFPILPVPSDLHVQLVQRVRTVRCYEPSLRAMSCGVRNAVD